MKKIIKTGFVVVLIFAVMLSAGCGGKKESQNEVIRIGSNRAIGTITPYLAEELGYFEGKDYQIEIFEFTDGAALMEAMAAGELDIGIVGISPVATWNAKGLDVRVVASANGGGHVIVSTTERGFSSVADLKGKVIAGPSPGTVTDTLLKSYIFPKYSMTSDDVTIITGMKGADMVTTLVNTDEVDAIVTWEPFISMAELTYDNIQVLYDASEEWLSGGKAGLFSLDVIAAMGDFFDNHEKELNDILNTIEKTVDYVEDNPEEANAKIAGLLDLETAVVERALKRSQLTFQVDKAAAMETLSWACDLGYLDELPEEEKLFDFHYISKE